MVEEWRSVDSGKGNTAEVGWWLSTGKNEPSNTVSSGGVSTSTLVWIAQESQVVLGNFEIVVCKTEGAGSSSGVETLLFVCISKTEKRVVQANTERKNMSGSEGLGFK